jgi:hypothetical protein
MFERTAIALLAFCLFALSPQASAETYRNAQYGFEVPVPEGFSICSGASNAPAPNHGLDIFLDQSDRRECEDVGKRWAIMFFANYNVLDDAKTLRAFLKWECNVRKGTCRAGPKGLSLGHRRTATGRVDQADGSIDIIVVAQGGHWSTHYAADPGFSIDYSVTLHTKRAFLDQDLVMLRHVLRHTRFAPPNE